ncbi:hypothetical protein BDY19DRAFT_542643 [Irpex rosettiformis]|uniref:Uncharacterized protein n=1 Tax=Irpex rosettiformis TaxID=378272 RepID=A0ACB8TQN4_9APHY|nr:hypothetical protein BDY19DRAFT_542643 [Irpex rosettiformis]
MPHSQDDPHEAHVHHLRLILGSILSPKRAPYARPTSSASPSGTASPALHHYQHDSCHKSEAGDHSPPARAPLFRSNTDSAIQGHSPHSSQHALPESVMNPHSAYGHPIPPPVASAPDLHNVSVDTTNVSRQARSDFIGTIQSKGAWEALIHGSFV